MNEANTNPSYLTKLFGQAIDKVLIREPGHRKYNPPADVADSAKTFWEYAVQSENAYIGDWKEQTASPASEKARELELPDPTQEQFESSCFSDERVPLPLPGWKRWEDFPSPKVIQEAREVGLYVEVWESESTPPVIAVVFRGTEFTSIKDWISNLRWFLRFVPLFKDQYTIIAEHVGQELVDTLVARQEKPKINGSAEVKIIATGHSLGGGLAQHLAYSLPAQANNGQDVPRVACVYAFNPSPVTGWFSVEKALRQANAEGLKIDRVFEHGEVLAYIRLFMSYLNPPTAANPSIREIRYNFVQSGNVIKSHSMRLLACNLIHYSGTASLPKLSERKLS